MTGLAHLEAPIPTRHQPVSITCVTCGDTGTLLAHRLDPDGKPITGPYAFRCAFCYRGKNDQRRFPMWDAQKGFKLL